MTLNGKKLIGYVKEECPICSRNRVEEWQNNNKKEYICEKCLWNITKQRYEKDDI